MAKKKQTKPDSKVQEAQNRNKYLRQLERVYSKIHPDLFSSLTREQQNILYIIRGTVVRARSEQKVPGYILRYCDDFIRDRMLQISIDIIPGKVKISLLEYSSYFFPLETWGGQMEEQFVGKDWYSEIMQGRDERIRQFEVLMNVFSILLMRHISNQQYTMYHVEYKMSHETLMNGLPRLIQKFNLKACNPREFFMAFDDKRKKSRCGLEVIYNGQQVLDGEVYNPLTPFFMLPSKLGVHTKGEEKPLPVLIFRHALTRLEERLGCLETGYVEYYIVSSFLNAETYKTSDGGVLVAYYLKKHKAGYFYVDIDEGAILIRTFLFLTNASTPEGQKLRKNIGLGKEDIKFLSIDRLTPLMESDILNDEELCDVFRNAGCECLIELCEELKDSDYWKQTEEKKQLADKLKKYMQLGDTVSE